MNDYHIIIMGKNVSISNAYVSAQNALEAFEKAVDCNSLCFYGQVDVLAKNQSNGVIMNFQAARE